MSKPGIWMPFFVGDYLGDTMSFDTTEHGAYLLLILEYWRNGPLPNDMRTLGKICRLSNKARSIVLQSVLLKFQLVGNEWRHKRIDLELQLANENQAIYIERAKKAAEARWKGHTPKDATSNATSTPNAMLENASPSPSPSPSIILPKGSIIPASAKPKKPPKIYFINQEKVKLTQEQYDSLRAEFAEDEISAFISRCENYCLSTGKSYKDYAATMRNWEKKPQRTNGNGNQQPQNLSVFERSQLVLKQAMEKELKKENDKATDNSAIDATFERVP